MILSSCLTDKDIAETVALGAFTPKSPVTD
jgi:hypothetical protein